MLLLQRKLKNRKDSLFHKKRGYQLVIDNLPAYVCQQCGQYLIRDEEVEMIQKILLELEDKVQQMEERLLSLPMPSGEVAISSI